ncbi:MAG TPA: anti-sigma factor [Candidatus Limnocylindrales bacterium]|nr:anti-sigma factor [Candidatus Limnocylindrales bacterium]
MDHAEALERLAVAAAESARGPDAPDRTLEQHLAGCPACRREARSLALADALLAAAAERGPGPSPEARDRLRHALRSAASKPAASPRVAARPVLRAHPERRSVGAALLAAVAVIVLAVAAGGWQLAAERDGAQARADRMARILAATERVLQDPGLYRAVLRDVSGSGASGSAFVGQSRELVVVVSWLGASGEDRLWCFLERDGQRHPVGAMRVQDGLAAWAGPVDGLPDPGRPGDRFVVTRDAAGAQVMVSGDF